ncbi:MAG TPA: aminopeptidase P family protein [Sulfolobales archaeon]|nr:aminopeptidase P family protein [Sulfolobales archaeon]
MESGLRIKILEEKLSRVSALVEELSLKGLLIASESMNKWFLGKGVSAITIISDKRARVYVPVLEYTRIRDHVSGAKDIEVIAYQRYPVEPPEDMPLIRGGVEDVIKKELSVKGAFGCDYSYLGKRLLEILSGKCVDLSEDLSRIRALKTKSEIEAISRSAEIASKAFTEVAGSVREGMSERELAGMLDRALRLHGSDGYAFPTIVASGPNASYPHAEPGDRRISSRDVVVIDMGAVYSGYVSDMTRMLVGSSVGSEELRALEAVEEALNTAIEKISPGVKASEVDGVARSVLEKKGYGKYFIHALGHGVGVEVHEPPLLARSSNDELREGYVVTIEPGVYIPGRFGIRLEELLVVTSKGAEILTKPSRIVRY